jgi:hypothetical protein
MSIRPVKRIVQSQPTIEGAGVKLRRAFGFGDTAETDPFLLLDRPIISRDSRGTLTAASRPSPMCSPAPWSTATAWEIAARLVQAMCNG